MDTPALPRLRVRMLGGFQLTGVEGGDLTLPRRKLRALVALLVLAPQAGRPREQLATLLWGGRDEEQARGSLRQALAELRLILGDDILLTDRETAGFRPGVVDADALEFTRLAAAGGLEQAAALYRGALLDGVSLPDAAFADWLLVERTRLHDLAVGVLARLLDRESGEAAIARAQRLLQLDPGHEETHRTLMRLWAAQRDRSLALRQYQLCRDALWRDLGVKPAPETERPFKEIQSSAKHAAGAATVEVPLRETGETEGGIPADTTRNFGPRPGDIVGEQSVKSVAEAVAVPDPQKGDMGIGARRTVGRFWRWPRLLGTSAGMRMPRLPSPGTMLFASSVRVLQPRCTTRPGFASGEATTSRGFGRGCGWPASLSPGPDESGPITDARRAPA